MQTLWHNLTQSAERGILRLRSGLLALSAAALQLAVDPDAMANWTARRWAIFASIVVLSAVGGALKAGEMNVAPAVKP